MAISVVMPALEMAQDTGKLVAWYKKSGETVTKGELLIEVETDKAVVEVAALADGILGGVTAQPGDVIPVGHTIAWILAEGESVPANTTESTAPAPTVAKPAAATGSPVSSATDRTSSGGARISPKARRLAKEHNVDLSTLQGSGVGGEILAADILAAANNSSTVAAPSSTAVGTEEKLTAIGRLMAERTTESWTTVPHFFVTREIDATALVRTRGELLTEVDSQKGVRPTITDLIVALVARSLVKHARLNATWTGQTVKLNPDINVALAMAVDDGVITAVIRNADKIGVAEIAIQRRDLTERARANRLRPEDISGATFTISNLGMYQVDSFTAIIVGPQAAILAVSAINDRAVPIDGKLEIRSMLTITLSADHRVVDGARAAAFLQTVAETMATLSKSLVTS